MATTTLVTPPGKPLASYLSLHAEKATSLRLRTIAAVVLLLGSAAALDYVTGAEISVAALYIFPVALAGWRLGKLSGSLVAIVCVGTNAILDHSWPVRPLTQFALRTELLRLSVFLVVCWFSALLSRQQQALASQRDALATQRDELRHMHRKLERELHAARAIQQVLVGTPPRHPAIECEVVLESARILGGDAVDLSLSLDERFAISVADVSGKGSPAALAGAVLVGLLADAPDRFDSPAATLSYLNERLESRLPGDMFVTLFYAVLDLRTGALTYASAGHEQPFVLRATGAVEELAAGDLPLASLPDTRYSDQQAMLNAGDILLCFTDGVTDQVRLDGSRAGISELRSWLQRQNRVSCRDLVASILERATLGTDELTDDLTLVALRYRGVVAG